MNGEVCIPLSVCETAPASVAESTRKGFKLKGGNGETFLIREARLSPPFVLHFSHSLAIFKPLEKPPRKVI